MIFRQLFDHTSSTYTYLISSGRGREALIIDPVLENVDRYLFKTCRNYTTLWARSVEGKNLGLVFTDGQFYWNQKNFCVKHLRGFGFGKSLMMETVMVEQASLLADQLVKKGGHTEVSNRLFSGPIINVLWSILAGEAIAHFNTNCNFIARVALQS